MILWQIFYGEKAAVLRREGLYQSQVREWRTERDARAAGLVPKRNSHRTSSKSSVSETDRLRLENARLTSVLSGSDIVGKFAAQVSAVPPCAQMVEEAGSVEEVWERPALTAAPVRLALLPAQPTIAATGDPGHGLSVEALDRGWAAVDASTSSATKVAYRGESAPDNGFWLRFRDHGWLWATAPVAALFRGRRRGSGWAGCRFGVITVRRG